MQLARRPLVLPEAICYQPQGCFIAKIETSVSINILVAHEYKSTVVTIFAKRGLIHTCAVSRCTFHHHLMPIYINGPTAHVCNTAKSLTVCFYSGLFSSLSDIHNCSGGLEMAIARSMPMCHADF